MSAKQTLGAYLRRGREQSGLSMEAVSAGSRIVPRLVEALEADRQDLLPAPVYVRGFIRAYCEQIGADTDEALRLYDEQTAPPPPLPSGRRCRRQPRRSRPRAAGAASPRSRPWASCWASPGSFSSGAATRMPSPAGRTGAVAPLREPSGVRRRRRRLRRTARSGPRPPPRLLRQRPRRPRPRSGAPTAGGARPAHARDRHDLGARPAGRRPRRPRRRSRPGAVREWRSAGRFRVTLGNAGGVELELDGRALPALGIRRPGGEGCRPFPASPSREVPLGSWRAPPGRARQDARRVRGWLRAHLPGAGARGRHRRGSGVAPPPGRSRARHHRGVRGAGPGAGPPRAASPAATPAARWRTICARRWPAPGRRSTSTRGRRSCSSSGSTDRGRRRLAGSSRGGSARRGTRSSSGRATRSARRRSSSSSAGVSGSASRS